MYWQVAEKGPVDVILRSRRQRRIAQVIGSLDGETFCLAQNDTHWTFFSNLLAYECRVIDRVPRIRLLPGERNREFALSHAQGLLYLEVAPQPLKDLALLIADTGLRVGEALNLAWRQVRLEPLNGAPFGFIHVLVGKSKYARRNVPITDRGGAMLEERAWTTDSIYVFP